VTRLTALAPGKVNLCLFVGAPRAGDGLHPLVSVVQPLSLADELTLAPAEGPGDEVHCPAVPGENLAARALAEFRAATGWDGPPVRVEIVKRVPVAAGMGGGSGDAAAALRLASVASGLPVPEGLAMRLGADVPSQLAPARTLMLGAGERVEPLPDGGAPLALVVVPVDAALSTPAVYRAFDERGLGREPAELERLEAAVRARPALPESLAVNDLEGPARALCPAIAPAADALAAHRPRRVMVSGSGPTVFAVLDGGRAEAVAGSLREAGWARAVAAAPVGPAFAEARPA
jgi:4-diphosphocytidyl-2-C-methyl-D-erythritol kinase